MTKLKQLDARLIELTTELAKWKLYVATSLVQGAQDGQTLLISVAKNNKTGFVYNVVPQELDKFADDPDTLIANLVEMAWERLYKEQIKNEIAPTIARALENAIKMRGRGLPT